MHSARPLITFSLTRQTPPLVDIPRDYARSPYRVVFHLFGRISGIPDSALIDEEILEFIWKLHEESMSVRLANLFDELRTKRLLLIGNAHPDWHAKTSTGCRSHRSN